MQPRQHHMQQPGKRAAFSARMKALWADSAWRAAHAAARAAGGRRKTSSARFKAHVGTGSKPFTLAPDHKAIIQGRTLFPSTVNEPSLGTAVLVSGEHQRKIGHRIVKGPWAGIPIYTLTLEERATCPRECQQFATCYGNGMPRAGRWRHGPEFEDALWAHLWWLDGRHHKTGFAVRLHVLGDFYSEGYVALWARALDAIKGLRVWGYTARKLMSPIGSAVDALNKRFPSRSMIRWSGEAGPMGSIVVDSAANAGSAIACPVETGRTANCGICGLCFAEGARNRAIAFVLHGNPGGPRAA